MLERLFWQRSIIIIHAALRLEEATAILSFASETKSLYGLWFREWDERGINIGLL